MRRFTTFFAGLGPAATLSAVVVLVAWGGLGGAARADDDPAVAAASRGAYDVATRQLLERLEENGMHDVVLWVLDRVDADATADKALKAASPFRRGVALVGMSRRETDSTKRGQILDEAQERFEAFLKAGGDAAAGDGDQKVVAFTQKGNLLVERARLAVDQAKRPGADAKAVSETAVKFFDDAFASFDSAEKEILAMLKNVGEELDTLAPPDAKKGEEAERPGGRRGKTAAERRRDAERLEELTEKQEVLRGQLLNTRLLLAGTQFEKSKAYATGSEGWKKALEDSTKRYAELFAKYSSRGAGLFARYYEGRNQAVFAQSVQKPEDRKKAFEKAIQTLADIRSLQGGGFVPGLRAKALNTTFECWLDLKNTKDFDESVEQMASAPVSPDKLDPDWLGMKYRAALILSQKADEEGPKGRPRKAIAQKIAMEVAKANRDFSKEARELLSKLGKDVGEGPAASFDTAMDEVSVILADWKQKTGEAKELEKANKADEAAVTLKAAGELRDKAIDALVKAMPSATEEELDKLNRARYLTTFLLYDAKRYHEAAALGEFLAERYPNSLGSKDAARVAMASWQLLAKDGRPEWAADARRRSADLAGAIVRIWPADSGSADAAVVAIASAAEQGDQKRIIELIDGVPKDSPRRAEVLIRGGSALWRAVLEQRRIAAADASSTGSADDSEQMLAKATAAIDEGLAAVAASGKADKLSVAAALYRCQIGMEQGANTLVEQTLTNPVYGPWTIAAGSDKSLVDQAVLEEVLRLSLRFFIQTEKLEDAQKAMDLLEAAAGEGEDASERLAAMYLAMGKELQDQLSGIVGGGSGEVDASARERAAKVVAGFEKFLERVGERDKKTSSQTWVATQFLALGAGPGQSGSGGIGQVVPKEKRQQFLTKSAAVFESLLKSGDEKVKQREKSTRLQLATVYRELGRWEDAIGHLEWIVSDPQRVNWLPAQIEAATFLEAAGAAGAGPNEGGDYLRQAVVGRQDGPIVFWGWGGLGNKLAKQAFTSASKDDAKAAETKRLFFESRLNVPRCRMKRAEKEEETDKRKELLEMAEKDIVLTHKLYPDLGGKEFRTRFDKMLEQIQKELGRPSARGLEDLEAEEKG